MRPQMRSQMRSQTRSQMRLQAYLARAGASPSRRKAEAVISAGRVRVNGSVALLGSKVSPGDVVLLDGERVLPSQPVYLALNKPPGYLTTMSDDRGRRTVADLMPDSPGLVPVGRLDIDTTGLLLLTSDGGFANLVTHPSSQIEKEYELIVETPKSDDPLKALAGGPTLEDGPMLPPRLTYETRRNTGNSISKTRLRLTIHEGRNRIIRRACEAVGLSLISLKRVRVGSVELGDLRSGDHRPLTRRELGGFE